MCRPWHIGASQEPGDHDAHDQRQCLAYQGQVDRVPDRGLKTALADAVSCHPDSDHVAASPGDDDWKLWRTTCAIGYSDRSATSNSSTVVEA